MSLWGIFNLFARQSLGSKRVPTTRENKQLASHGTRIRIFRSDIELHTSVTRTSCIDELHWFRPASRWRARHSHYTFHYFYRLLRASRNERFNEIRVYYCPAGHTDKTINCAPGRPTQLFSFCLEIHASRPEVNTSRSFIQRTAFASGV